MRAVICVLGAVVGLGASAALAQTADRSGALQFPERLSAEGADSERWAVETEDDVDAKRTEGGVRISGVRMGNAGAFDDVEWSIAGSEVSGVAKGPGGQPLARFEGKLSGGRLQGTFTTFTGQTGDWEWEGPLPAELTGD